MENLLRASTGDPLPVLQHKLALQIGEKLGPEAAHTRRARAALQALTAPGEYRLPPWDGSQLFVP